MSKRVVVTGMGIISPVGNNVETYWKNLLDGVCGIEFITDFDTTPLPVKIAGTIKDFHPEEYGIDKPFARKQDLFTLYGVAAAYQAMKQAGLHSEGEEQNIDPFRLGVYVGSGIGGFTTQVRETQKILEDPSGQWVSPLFIPTMISNIAAGHIAIKHHAQGPTIDVVTACATSTNAIGEAYRAIKHGYADAIIAGGCEHATIPLGIAGFANAKALSRAEDPKYASLPFNANRGGFVMGDGAGILVLEEYEHAKARGAEIIAEVVGYGNTCDAYHYTAPRPDGTVTAKAIKDSLVEGGFKESDSLYINAHGTGTALNDKAETVAIKLALGEELARKASISSTKSMHGHMLGAAGAIELVISALAVKNGIVPPTIGLTSPDPECDLNYTPLVPEKKDIDFAVSESLGFGGHNACVAIKKI